MAAEKTEGNTQVVFYLDQETIDALRAWAKQQDRSMSAQARTVFRDAIPNEFFASAGG